MKLTNPEILHALRNKKLVICKQDQVRCYVDETAHVMLDFWGVQRSITIGYLATSDWEIIEGRN